MIIIFLNKWVQQLNKFSKIWNNFDLEWFSFLHFFLSFFISLILSIVFSFLIPYLSSGYSDLNEENEAFFCKRQLKLFSFL